MCTNVMASKEFMKVIVTLLTILQQQWLYYIATWSSNFIYVNACKEICQQQLQLLSYLTPSVKMIRFVIGRRSIIYWLV